MFKLLVLRPRVVLKSIVLMESVRTKRLMVKLAVTITSANPTNVWEVNVHVVQDPAALAPTPITFVIQMENAKQNWQMEKIVNTRQMIVGANPAIAQQGFNQTVNSLHLFVGLRGRSLVFSKTSLHL